MKTTNYKISKQLAEAGFRTETEFYWAKWHKEGESEIMTTNQETPNLFEAVPAYDLETILEALPKNIDIKNKTYGLRVHFSADIFIGYQDFQGFHLEFNFMKESKSLADVAARLWLKLKKEGLA